MFMKHIFCLWAGFFALQICPANSRMLRCADDLDFGVFVPYFRIIVFRHPCIACALFLLPM